MVDVVCARTPRAGERVHADIVIRAGGSAVNAALAAADASATASVVGKIGRDAAAEVVLAELATRGVRAVLARDADAPTGTAVVFPTADGASVVAARGANAHLAVDDVPAAIDAEALFVSGFALFQHGSADAARAAIDRFTGDLVGIDVASPRLAAAARDAELSFGDRKTVLFANAAEAHALTGAAPADAATALATRVSIACVKLDDAGAVGVAGRTTAHATAPAVAEASPFGAGDAFAGALLVALGRGEPLDGALELACAAGARAAARSR
jgi:ribokinase